MEGTTCCSQRQQEHRPTLSENIALYELPWGSWECEKASVYLATCCQRVTFPCCKFPCGGAASVWQLSRARARERSRSRGRWRVLPRHMYYFSWDVVAAATASKAAEADGEPVLFSVPFCLNRFMEAFSGT